MPRFPTEPDPYRNTPFPPTFIPVLSTSRVSAQAVARPNRIRYSDTGIKPAAASVGSVSLQLRALAGKDGTTLVEATTGTFQGREGLDIIEKVQLKSSTASLPPVNDWPGTPEWSYPTAALTPGDQLQVQANVKSPRGGKAQVLMLSTTVARRPDLAVVSLDGAAQSYPNTPVTFFAPVAELNGDVGARANCLLSVNGTPVDQATDIWVDASGVVTCQFVYSFEAAGTHTVSIGAVEVDPGDWDLSNNSYSTTITIVSPGTPIAFGQLSVVDENYTYSNTATRTGSYPLESTSGGSQVRSAVNFYGTAVEAVPAPVQRVEARVSTGGTTINESTLTQLTAYQYQAGSATVSCIQFRLNGEQADSCTTSYPDGSGSAWFAYVHSSGTVTYYGSTLYCNTFGCNTYTDNGTTVTGWGQRYGLTSGSLVRVEVAFVDATGTRRVSDRSVTLEDFSGPVNYSRSECAPYWDGLGDVCRTETSTGTVWRGTTTW